MRLYELTEELATAQKILFDSCLDEDIINDTLESISGDFEEKCVKILLVAKELDALVLAIDDEVLTMRSRAETYKDKRDRLIDYVKASMERVGKKTIIHPLVDGVVKNNPPRVVIDSPKTVPPEFMRQPKMPDKEPDKKLIGEFLKQTDMPCSWALLEKTTMLDVK